MIKKTRQQLINELKAIGTEYEFRDIGYGGFYGDDNTFKVAGVEYTPTNKELQQMIDQAYRNLLGDDDDVEYLINAILNDRK